MAAEYKIFKLKTAREYKFTMDYVLKALKEIHDNPDEHNYSLSEVERLLNIENKINEASNSFMKAANEITQIFENFKSVATEHKIAFGSFISQLKKISKAGWLISPSLIRDLSLEQLIEINKNPFSKEAEKIICETYSPNIKIQSIIESLIRTFPNRKSILLEILNCYELKLYSAVIALSYTQADGICNDIWNYGFFDKDPSKSFQNKLYLELNNMELGFSSHFVSQLGISDNEIIMFSKDKLFQEKSIREKSNNRHLVIHGHSTNYGDLPNSLRAIFILDFLEHFAIEHQDN